MIQVPHLTIPVFLFLLIMSCQSNTPIDREAVREEMASREIKRVTKAEMLNKAKEIGDSRVILANDRLIALLEDANNPDKVSLNLDKCQNTIDTSGGIIAYRVNTNFRNELNAPDSLERLMLEAYSYGIENDIDTPPNVQEENERYILYTTPILIQDNLCLNCHGEIGKDISNHFYDSILGFYPKDQSINYKKGDLIGIWSLKIPKKLIVQSI